MSNQEIKVGQKIQMSGWTKSKDFGVVFKIEEIYSYPKQITKVYLCKMNDGKEKAFLAIEINPFSTVEKKQSVAAQRRAIWNHA